MYKHIFFLLLLTLNVPFQIGKCTTRGTCTPVWEPLSYHKRRNTKKFTVFLTMLDTQIIIAFFVLFCKQIHASACQKFSFRSSSLSILISDN